MTEIKLWILANPWLAAGLALVAHNAMTFTLHQVVCKRFGMLCPAAIVSTMAAITLAGALWTASPAWSAAIILGGAAAIYGIVRLWASPSFKVDVGGGDTR